MASRRKHQQFKSLSRTKRGRLAFDLKNWIRREADYNGGRFACHQTEWTAPAPVPRDRLPIISMDEAREKGEYTSGMFGAAVRWPLE